MHKLAMNCKLASILAICTLLVLLIWKLLPRSAETNEKVVLNPIKHSFPGIDSRTCDESCSPSIISELYHHWNEETKSLQDPPFSPILYWKDLDKKPNYNLKFTDPDFQSWTCIEDDNWCRNLEWYMSHCHVSNDRFRSSFTFKLYTDGTGEMAVLTWSRHSCERSMGSEAIILEENLPFLQGRVKGTVAIVRNAIRISFPDPVGGSCWHAFCSLHDDGYQECLQDAQLSIVEVPLETFIEIKDVACK